MNIHQLIIRLNAIENELVWLKLIIERGYDLTKIARNGKYEFITNSNEQLLKKYTKLRRILKKHSERYK